MTERKLRMAVPKGWLIHRRRWNVGNVLKLAGIGKYEFQCSDVLGIDSIYYKPNIAPKVASFLPFTFGNTKVLAAPIRPADIPNFLRPGIFDCGITGKDLIIESRPLSYERRFREICDLQCGYVDLIFATTQERWETVKSYNDYKKSKLEVFLSNYRTSEPILCLTRYPNIARNQIDKVGFGKREVRVVGVQGASEEYLECDTGDFILESMATGDSVRNYELEVLSSVLNSTARLYIPHTLLFKGTADPKREWKRKKIKEIKERIENVLKDIDNYCQVRFLFDIGFPTWSLKHEKNCGLEQSLEFDLFRKRYFRKKPISIYYHPYYETPSFHTPFLSVDRIMKKKDFPKVQRYKSECRDGISFKNGEVESIAKLCGVIALDLKSLYAYCPLLTSPDTSTLERCSGTLLEEGKYPCCDISKFRPEHREQATLYSYITNEKCHQLIFS